MARTVQQHHRLDPRVPGLPARQDPPPHTPGPQPILIHQRSFSHLQVGLVGPLQYSNSFNYIFTIIDCTSKWMEATPLSEMSMAACAKALTFSWIIRLVKKKLSVELHVLGYPKRSLRIAGHYLLPIFGFNSARCWTSHTDKKLLIILIILSQTEKSKDGTTASRMRFAHSPPRRHGPRNYPLCSSDSTHSREKTMVFPWLRQFLALQLLIDWKNFLLSIFCTI